MERDRKTILAVVITVIILGAVFSGFWFTLFWRQTPQVVLPTAGSAAAEPSLDGGGEGDGELVVEVTPETVQNVIGTLSRPDSYYREITLESFWGEGESAASTAMIWVDGGYVRVAVLLPDGQVEHTIVGEGSRYRWYNDERRYFHTDAGAEDADLMQRIPTYEDILALDPSAITAAGYEEKEGLGCVYVEVLEEQLGYRERYWVSVDLGLLVAAETVKGEKTVLRATAYSMEIPVRGGQPFLLPDGTQLHEPTVS